MEGPTSVDEVTRVSRAFPGKVFYNMTGVSPRFTLAQMNELGIAVAITPGSTFRVTMQAVYDYAVALRDHGPMAEHDFNERFKTHPMGNVHRFAGFDEIQAWETEFLPPEELEKYEDSVGYRPAG